MRNREGDKSFIEWLDELKPKPKFYIWTQKEKQQVKDMCLAVRDMYLYLMVEAQSISFKKAVEILESKHSL